MAPSGTGQKFVKGPGRALRPTVDRERLKKKMKVIVINHSTNSILEMPDVHVTSLILLNNYL